MGRRTKIVLPDDINPKGIDFTKFNNEPLLLLQHKWDELPIGEVKNIKLSPKGLYCTLQFHKLTDASKYVSFLKRNGLIIQVHAGGVKANDKFILYELSVCP